ncbi:PREDICTED: (3S,6E)-nerolidol synthase 1 isoform X3 [Lupinus angustifolius]|nr:PREDICTED: (3S,6E)-nerolidol synthase 1 isoform X1 [Lupinus angustifolius]XP_019426258.1 PREDICTED: (3S,6E)-nerolidol synthase 1 isoform X3 [Lupinus angustifolius]
MTLQLKSLFFPKTEIVATKAPRSQSIKYVKCGYQPPSNKWNIVQEDFLNNNHEEKLKVLKHVLANGSKSSLQKLYMIDAMQHLNIDYHFQEEIDDFLWKEYVIYSNSGDGFGHHDLHQIALHFRLFRQQGHYVPPEVFNKFIDKRGKFNQRLCGNMKGIRDLYEASHLSIAGEDILDEAEQFSKQVLKERLLGDCFDNHEAKLIRNTLQHPSHKSLAMLTGREFFGDFHSMNNGWLGSFKDFAKIDFSLQQHLHQQEILQISRWWTELGLGNELKYARNQPLKWYMWSLACLTDPTLSEERVELTKAISFIYIIDDTFDVYGSLQELTMFTEVVSRWDIEASEQLPDSMKICFKALYNLNNEISTKIYTKHGFNPTHSLRKAWESLCKAFLVEAEWFGCGNIPSGEEYLKNGIISSGVHIVLVHIFFLLGQRLTQHNVEIIDRSPMIISSAAKILRLWDDLGTAKDENQEGNDGSYVYCLLMEHQDMSLKRAREEVMSMISDAWKNLNQECLFQKSFQTTFTKACLNLARMVPLIYNYDNKRYIQDYINSLISDPVIM